MLVAYAWGICMLKQRIWKNKRNRSIEIYIVCIQLIWILDYTVPMCTSSPVVRPNGKCARRWEFKNSAAAGVLFWV
jgi:hypothetical protein